jgi:Major Facilitator Superfamily
VPIGLATAALAPRLAPESRATVARPSFDLAGALSVTSGLTALVCALVRVSAVGWGPLETIATLLAAVLLGAFLVIETRAKAPLVPFRFFRLGTVRAANITMLAMGAAVVGLFHFLSLYLQQVLGYSALKAGLSQLPLAGGIVAAAGIASPLITRLGIKPVLLGRLGLIAAGLAWFAQAPTHDAFLADLLGPSLLVAVGLGFAFVALTVASMSVVSDQQTGLANGLINTAQQIGGAIGLAILSTIATTSTNSAIKAGAGNPDVLPAALTHGFHQAFLAGAGFATLAAVLAGILLGATKRHAPEAHTIPQPIA